MNFKFWLRNKSKQEKSIVQKVQFLGEQDGIPEQIFKGDLNKFFATVPSVNSAYLARVIYNNRKSPFEIALCISAKIDTEREKVLLAEIGKIFSKLFNSDTHMDMLFLKDGQENELKNVCKPFYVKK